MKRILVVDDDEAIVRLLVRLFTLAGYAVSTAANGREALSALRRVRPAVIVLDYAMPVMDGAACVQELQRRGERVPVVMMSAGAQGQQQARELGVQAFAAKPFDPDDLLALVEHTAA